MGKGFKVTNIAPPSLGFYPNKVLNVSDKDWTFKHLFIGDPAAKATSLETATYTDIQYLYPNGNDYCLYVGGHYTYGASAGLFFANCNNNLSNNNSNLGSRLAKRTFYTMKPHNYGGADRVCILGNMFLLLSMTFGSTSCATRTIASVSYSGNKFHFAFGLLRCATCPFPMGNDTSR